MNESLLLDRQLCFRLYSASRLLTQVYHPMLSKLGLTYPQYLVMMVLWEKDAQPVNDIAMRLFLETNTVTPLLKRMEAAGLVSRRRNAGSADARQVIVSLTGKGKAMENEVLGIPEAVAKSVVCDSITPETAPMLFGMLDDIIHKLSSENLAFLERNP